ncbi:hypothetical protein CLF_110789 [Clonorchis sinensis]|uniref:Uncharacterized protein n=1 Tax=Clonorchis sinensis TaxID=79923 RepID=G7YTW0_CLOSI|nr:hypothetical protein CLF_110789 [Clonorchis sinensis]
MHRQTTASTRLFQIVLVWSCLASVRYVVDALQTMASNKDWEPSEEQHGADPIEDETLSRLRIDLIYGITADHKALITCEVNILEDPKHDGGRSTASFDTTPMSTVYLLCPQISTSICYMDCTPNCVLGDRGCTVPQAISQVINRCDYKRINATRLLVDYVIDLEALNNTGQWNCAYRGQHASRPLELRAVERRPVTTARFSTPDQTGMSATTMNPPKSSTPTGNGLKSPSTRKVSGGTYSNRSINTMEQASGSQRIRQESGHETIKLTRPELVVILLIVLAISLLFNVILSVRCALTKTFLDNMSRGKVDSTLSRLLCFRQKSKSIQLYSNSPCPVLITRNTPVPTVTTNLTSLHNSTSLEETAIDNPMFYTTQRLSPVSDGTGMTMPNLLYQSMFLHPPCSAPTPVQLGELKRHALANGVYPPAHSIPFGDEYVRQHYAADLVNPRLIGEGFASVQPNGIGNLGGPTHNESLTGSVVLTNDSASFTDGLGTPFTIGNRSIPQQCPSPQFSGHHTDESQGNFIERSKQPDQVELGPLQSALLHSSSQQQFDFGKPQLAPSHSSNRIQLRTGSPESYDCGQTVRSVTVRSEMTPLVVRFPSGEAGLLICPGTTGEESFGIRSPPKPILVRRSTSNCSSFANSRQAQSHLTTSTLLTTDTDSEQGYVELVRKGLIHSVSRSRQDEKEITTALLSHNRNGGTKETKGSDEDTVKMRHLLQDTEDLPKSTKDSIKSIDRSNSETDSIGLSFKSETPGYVLLPSHQISNRQQKTVKDEPAISESFTAFKPAVPCKAPNGMMRPNISFNKPPTADSHML